MTGKVSWF